MSLTTPRNIKLEKQQVAIYLMRPDAVSDEQLPLLRSMLSDSELQRNQRYARASIRRRDVVCRGVLRQLIAGRLQCAPGELELLEGDHGKPLLSKKELFFNYSHSGDYAAFALCWDAEVGVDIERVRERTDGMAIAKSQFANSEYQSLLRTPNISQRQRFFQYWTVKEAFLKARGDGIAGGLNTFSIGIDEDPPRITVSFNDGRPEHPGDWQFYSAEPIKDYWLALAVQAKGRQYDIAHYA
ncbi:MAG: 4'-phosphopantetheinyl transferase superfamily protein [Pseudomonadota bacterium]